MEERERDLEYWKEELRKVKRSCIRRKLTQKPKE